MPYTGLMATEGQALMAQPEDVAMTQLAEARTEAEALAVVAKLRPSVVRAVYDLQGQDPEGHGVAWLRRAVVREARA
jgi:hypothetical protein